MVHLFRSASRKGQWDKTLNYSKVVSRATPTTCIISTVAVLCLICVTYKTGIFSYITENQVIATEPHTNIRHLLSAAPFDPNKTYYNYKCERQNHSSKQALSWETCDYENGTGVPGAWIFFYIFITIIIFVALAIVCDDFFVPSLEAISEKLNLSEDVAGATFMAAGSSAPELFSSIAAVTFDSDAGVGTIAGSAVFNLLVIISLTAAFAGKVLTLDWRPLARDSVWYLLSIIFFIVMVFDSIVEIWEAAILLILYAIYIIIMVFNPRLMSCLEKIGKKCPCNCCDVTTVEPIDAETGDKSNGADRRQSILSSQSGEERRTFKHDRRNSIMQTLHSSKSSLRESKQTGMQPMTSNHLEVRENGSTLKENGSSKETTPEADDEEGKEEEEDEGRIKCCCSCCPDIRGAPPEKSEEMTKTKWLVYVLKWIIFVLSFPFLLGFSYTIPECSKEHLKKYFLVSFIVSVMWIAGLSFGMVTVVARTGCLMGVDTFVMSLVVLAAGTSIPDLLSSIIVARDGYGDMAVSNAIGSNVFDIDLGLGLPFLIRIGVNKAVPLDMFSDNERRAYCEGKMLVNPYVKFGSILIILLVICLTIICISRFRLGKLIGITFFIMYIAFLVYAFCQEFLCNQPGLYNC